MFCNLSVSCGIDQEKSFSITVVSIFCKNMLSKKYALPSKHAHFTSQPCRKHSLDTEKYICQARAPQLLEACGKPSEHTLLRGISIC